MTGRRKGWKDLTSVQRGGIVVVGLVTTLWQIAMLWDLWKRPAEQIRGSKRAWAAASFVRPFGQIAYLCWGRHPTDPDTSARSPSRAWKGARRSRAGA